MRFRFQAPAILTAGFCHLALLPSMCNDQHSPQPVRWCLAAGGCRVVLYALALPLVCCYATEVHARRLFVAQEARRRQC
jgi:hypothetical protein